MNVETDDHSTDLRLVCRRALDWAGDYGWRNQEKALEVCQAIDRLIPGTTSKYFGMTTNEWFSIKDV
jgi:hypothetical protein